tara:strand:+ start:460 stop:666 length:207 start_codon:yes stop_codon:yes gene_type:complete
MSEAILLHFIGGLMTYSAKLNYAAQTFIEMLREYPDQNPMDIAEIICFHWEVERLDLDEKTWEIKNNK